MWILYQIALTVLLLASAPVLLLLRGRHYLPTLPGRLGGHSGRVVRGAVWLHAVSVGEVAVAATLARALPEDLPLLVTTVTPTGQQRAHEIFGPGSAFEGRAAVAYLPFDLGFAVRRFLDRFEPRALVLVEGDYWPLILRHVRRRHLPAAVINGRVGDANARRLARLGPFTRPLFEAVDRFGVQSPRDRDRLIAAGVAAEGVAVTGNLKYETPEPVRKPPLERRIRELASGRAVLVAGSTMGGEEPQVVEAFEPLSRRALLVLAPRHPERWAEVANFLERRGIACLRRSRWEDAEPPARDEPADVLLLDSLGELAGLYVLADAAFIGGTLVPTGGHNPLEPARFGVPVAVGPSMENFRDMAAEFDREHAWARARDAGELAAVWRGWLDDPETAREVGRRGAALVERNRGSLERTVSMLREVGILPAEVAGPSA
jgi:3-deoxy-D-manno-octulosonic-acid transferase